MQRSHMARKHRIAKDRTDEGVFDSAQASEARALHKSLSTPTRHKTVRHALAGGIATTFLRDRRADGASTPGSDASDADDADRRRGGGTDGGSDDTGVDAVDARLVADGSERVTEASPKNRLGALPIPKAHSNAPHAGRASLEEARAESPAESPTKGYVRASVSQREEDEEAEKATTPMSTQRGPWRSLREYESLHPADDSPDRGASPGALSLSGGVLMEELLTRGVSGEGEDVTKVDVKKVKGIALMLEVAKADDLLSVQGCVEEYGLELTSVACVNTSGTSALHAAASGGATRVARHLVTKVCVDVNATDNWGNTPLDEAQRAGKEEMCRFLIAAGGYLGSDRSDTFVKQRPSPSPRFQESPSGSRGGSLHGGDIAYLALNHSPVEFSRTNSNTNLAMLQGGAKSPRAESPRAPPRRGGMRRRRNSLSDLCLENIRHEQSALPPADAAYAAIRTATAAAATAAAATAGVPGGDKISSPTSPPSPDFAGQLADSTSPTARHKGNEASPSGVSDAGGGYDFDVRDDVNTTITSAVPDAHDEWEVMPWDVRVDIKVGEGAFGEIRRATWRGVDVAVKTLKADCASDAIALKEFNREMSIWSRLVHPSIVQFLGVGYRHDTPRLMLCEYMEGGSLQQKLMQMNASAKKFLFDQGFAVIKGIAGAMTYMHSRRPFAVIHRDLKPANILLTATGEAKVADFGLSKMMDIDTPRGMNDAGQPGPFDDSAHDERARGGAEAEEDAAARPAVPPPSPPSPMFADVRAAGATRGATPEERAAHELLETRRLDYGEQVYSQLYDHAFLMTGETGAYKYMAPEVFKNELYGLKCDVYSFAMIAYEVFEGIMLLRDPVSWAHGASGPDETRPAWMFLPAYDTRRTAECIELLEQCWHGDPKERPTFMKISSEFKRIARIPRSERPRSASKKKLRVGLDSTRSLSTRSGGSGTLSGDAPDGGEDKRAPQCACVVS